MTYIDMTILSPDWYAVKGLFRWFHTESGETTSVEERIVVFQATSFDHALALAELEAADYCASVSPKQTFTIEPMSWWNAYHIGEESPTSGIEAYSRIVETALSAQAFLRRYYPKSHDRTIPSV